MAFFTGILGLSAVSLAVVGWAIAALVNPILVIGALVCCLLVIILGNNSESRLGRAGCFMGFITLLLLGLTCLAIQVAAGNFSSVAVFSNSFYL